MKLIDSPTHLIISLCRHFKMGKCVFFSVFFFLFCMQPFSSQTELCLLRAVIVCVCLLLLLLALLDDDNLANELLDWQRDWAKSQRHCVLCWLTKRPAEPQANIATKTKTTIWAARAFSAFSSWEYLCFFFYFTLSRRWTAQNFEQQKKENISWRSA